MEEKIAFTIKDDIYDKFCLALNLSKEEEDRALETCLKWYITKTFGKVYLLIKENGKRVLFSGCSHKGILNITEWFEPDVLIGGFHFMKLDPSTKDADVLTAAADELLSYDAKYYTCHCTGIEQFEFLKRIMGDKLSYLSTGMKLEI